MFSAQFEIYLVTSSYCFQSYTNMTSEHWLSKFEVNLLMSSPVVRVLVIHAFVFLFFIKYTAIFAQMKELQICFSCRHYETCIGSLVSSLLTVFFPKQIKHYKHCRDEKLMMQNEFIQ